MAPQDFLPSRHSRVTTVSTSPRRRERGDARAGWWALLRAAHVLIDPYPFGGGVTTLEALAACAPVVTAPALQTVPQLAAGFYRRLGLDEARRAGGRAPSAARTCYLPPAVVTGESSSHAARAFSLESAYLGTLSGPSAVVTGETCRRRPLR